MTAAARGKALRATPFAPCHAHPSPPSGGQRTRQDIHLSTVDHHSVDFHPWLTIQSARWLSFTSAPTLIINSTEGMPSSSVYASRFGSLVRAYRLVGYTPARDYQYIEINRLLRQLHPTVVSDTESQMEALGGKVRRHGDTDLLRINDEFDVSLVLARCQRLTNGNLFWKIRLDSGLFPDLTVAVRLTPENKSALDYYLLPRIDIAGPRIRLGERNPIELESYRFENLDYFYRMAARTRLKRAA